MGSRFLKRNIRDKCIMPVVFMAFFDSVFSLTYFMIFAPQEFIERYRDTSGDIGAKIFVIAHMVVFSILLLYFILVLIFPRLSRIMRKNPRLFELLDEAYEKRLYESDNFFTATAFSFLKSSGRLWLFFWTRYG